MTTVAKQVVFDCDELRHFCIKHQLFTRGTVEQYSEMFEKAYRFDGSDEQLEWIARCILAHSSTESLSDFTYNGEDTHHIICAIMTRVWDECVTIWYE